MTTLDAIENKCPHCHHIIAIPNDKQISLPSICTKTKKIHKIIKTTETSYYKSDTTYISVADKGNTNLSTPSTPSSVSPDTTVSTPSSGGCYEFEYVSETDTSDSEAEKPSEDETIQNTINSTSSSIQSTLSYATIEPPPTIKKA